MWDTVFVVGSKEIPKRKELPPLVEGGKIMLYAEDQFDKTQVPKTYRITQVIFDIYSVKQYVYLEEFMP